MTAWPRFHLAIPVDDLSAAEAFYAGVLQCPIGRSDENWIDFDMMGHQLVVHKTTRPPTVTDSATDGETVPIPHFGVILEWARWEALMERLRVCGVTFALDPTVRFAGEIGEQATAFVFDPAGNALEFKTFRNPDEVFRAGQDDAG